MNQDTRDWLKEAAANTEEVIGGIFAWVFGLCTSLGGLYLFIRFLKMAWEG